MINLDLKSRSRSILRRRFPRRRPSARPSPPCPRSAGSRFALCKAATAVGRIRRPRKGGATSVGGVIALSTKLGPFFAFLENLIEISSVTSHLSVCMCGHRDDAIAWQVCHPTYLPSQPGGQSSVHAAICPLVLYHSASLRLSAPRICASVSMVILEVQKCKGSRITNPKHPNIVVCCLSSPWSSKRADAEFGNVLERSLDQKCKGIWRKIERTWARAGRPQAGPYSALKGTENWRRRHRPRPRSVRRQLHKSNP